MRILFVAPRYDYGDPARGLSFEHYNFFDTLVNMGHDVTYFDFLDEYQKRGKEAMNRLLLDTVRSESPDLLFAVLFTDELDVDTVTRISRETDTVTFNWFCDDHWRFENFTRYWAPAFNWVSTTAQSALPKYEAIGYTHVIKTQWACNHFLYRQLDLPKLYDVSFVGQPHGTRRETMNQLRAHGIEVKTWGYGWDTGRLSQEEMIAVFNQSRVNLNLANASTTGRPVSRWRRLLPGSSRLRSQIKGRNFEIPGCGAFLLTDPAENLGEYYHLDREVATFDRPRQLPQRIRFYLEHEAEREAIATAGHARTLAEHTYERRFSEAFAAMGLMTPQSTAAHGE